MSSVRGPYKRPTWNKPDKRFVAASDDDVVVATLELVGWFWPHQLYSISHDQHVCRVLNRLVRSGDLEKRRDSRSATVQYRWVN